MSEFDSNLFLPFCGAIKGNTSANGNKNVAICYNYGVAWLEKRKYENAKQCFERCVKLDPRNLGCLYNLSIAFIGLGEMEKAERKLKLILSCWPTYANAFLALAGIKRQARLGMSQRKDLSGPDIVFLKQIMAEEENLLKKAIQIDSGDSTVRQCLSKFYKEKGNMIKALEYDDFESLPINSKNRGKGNYLFEN